MGPRARGNVQICKVNTRGEAALGFCIVERGAPWFLDGCVLPRLYDGYGRGWNIFGVLYDSFWERVFYLGFMTSFGVGYRLRVL